MKDKYNVLYNRLLVKTKSSLELLDIIKVGGSMATSR